MKIDFPEFSDNVNVKKATKRNGYMREFLSLSLAPTDAEWKPYEVSIRRYCLPGRCDTYCFDYTPSIGTGIGARIRYFSDDWMALPRALSLAARDLDRPQVVELFINAFSAESCVLKYRHDTIQLLKVIGPKSKTLREVEKLTKRIMEECYARFGQPKDFVR